MTAKEKWLIVLLRIGGVMMGSAFFTIFLPTEWMASTHRWLGLGEFPESPLVEYLTRSISGLYCIHGGLLFVLSLDVRRYSAVITFFAYADVAFGLILIWIDLRAGLPLFWTLSEGPPVFLIGLVMLWLLRPDHERPAGSPEGAGEPEPSFAGRTTGSRSL